MIYIEVQLSGTVQVYELSDQSVLLRVTIEAQAEWLPIPNTMTEALDYLSARCCQLEFFEDLESAIEWAESFTGFRAGEVRAELGRFEARRAKYGPPVARVMVA